MSQELQSVTHIQVENVPELQHIQFADGIPEGATVTFIDSSSLDQQQIIDLPPGIEIYQTIQLQDGSEHVLLEQPLLTQITNGACNIHQIHLPTSCIPHSEVLPAIQLPVMPAKEPEDIKAPIGKGPYNCEFCDKIFKKWNQLQRHIKSHDDDKPFQCSSCSASFNVEDNLLLHEATHVREDQDPICPECGKKFSRVASLKAHIMLHEKEENLMCPECGDEFGLQSQLDRHMLEHRQEHVGVRMFPCRQCNQEFTKLPLLRQHMKQHYKVRASLSHRTYKRDIDRSSFGNRCKHCNKHFQKPSQLQRHERIHTGERPYKCDECDRTFNQKGALQIHKTKHTGKKPHLCDFCPSAFAQKGNLRAHIQRVHTITKDSNGPTYECGECSCMFKKLGSLNAHVSRAHSESTEEWTTTWNNRPAKDNDEAQVIEQLLEMTEQTSTDNQGNPPPSQITDNNINIVEEQTSVENEMVDPSTSDLLQQALENSGLPNKGDGTETGPDTSVSTSQPISIQPTVSTTMSTLTTMTIHDTATGIVKKHFIRKVNGVRWHQCNYCAKEFKKPSDLVRHIRIHTHEKPYKCTQCFRSFAVKSTLTAHIKTHTGVKDYRCDQCRKLFSTQGSLKVHLRLHTGAKPFNCPQCDKKFRTSAHRKSHIQCHIRGECISGIMDRRPRRTIKRPPRLSDANLPEIPLQEPILITDTGLIQQPPRNNVFTQYLGEASSADRPYKCNHCNRGFKKSSHLKQHVRSHTGEKPYRCGQCTRSFVSSGVLKAHLRTHSGVKEYRCIICETMFTTNGSLKRHMSTHSEVRPFMCPYCQKTFKTSVNCKKHMKTHKHELALQAMNQDPNAQPVQQDNVTLAPDGTQIGQSTTDITVLQQQEIGHTTTIGQVELSQANLQDALPGTGLDQSLHSTLHSQVFGQQQSFGETILNSHQPFGQLGAQQVEQQLATTINTPLTQHLTNQHDFTGQVTNMSNQITSQLNHDMATLNHLQNSQYQNTIQLHPMDSTPLITTTSVPSVGNIYNMEEAIIEEVQDMEEQPVEIQQTNILTSEDSHRTYQCGNCEKAFKKSSHLKQHIRSHTGEKPYRCIQCDRTFVSSGVLRAHSKTHTGHKDYRCPLCQALFTTNGSLTRHMVIHNSAQTVSCPFCSETFRNIVLCKRHLKTAHKVQREDQDENQVPSESLQQVQPLQQIQQQQIIQVSDDMTRELAKVTVEELTLSEKILMESAVEKDRISESKDPSDSMEIIEPKHAYRCTHCVKSFKKPSDLQRHVRTHTGEKPYCCEICNRSFTVKSTLASHIKTHGSCDKVYKCHVCDSLFSTKGSLKVHMRLHTGARPFKCTHCDQRFRTSGHRKSHILTHFKDNTTAAPKKRKSFPRSQDNNHIQLINQQTGEDQNLANQVMTIDPSMLAQQNIMPVSLTVADGMGGTLGESALAAHVLQGLDGIQLHFTGNLGQGMQMDPNILSQTVQIDANLLQQLQQQGNINITINPNMINQSLTPSADPNLVQNIQVQQNVSISDAMNPNILIQPNMVMSQSEMPTVSSSYDSTVAIKDEEATYTVATDQQITVNQLDDRDTVIPDEEEEMTLGNEEQEDVDDIDDGDLTELGSHGDNIMTSDMITNMAGGDSADFSLQKPDPNRLHVCGICEKGFKRAGHLRDHLSTHGIAPKLARDKVHKCCDCDKSFEKPSQLARHARIHSGERPFICIICQKAFNQKNALQIHLRRHSDERPHICSYCGKTFLQKGNLKTHIKRAHHLDMVQSMILPQSISEAAMVTNQVSMETNPDPIQAEPAEDGMDMSELFENSAEALKV